MISTSLESKDIVKEGFLEKQSKFLKEWRKRWFVITKTTLYSFKDERGRKDPTEIISLKECTTIKSAEDETHKPNSIRLDCVNRTFYLVAATNNEKEAWIGAIGKCMVKLNSARISDDE